LTVGGGGLGGSCTLSGGDLSRVVIDASGVFCGGGVISVFFVVVGSAAF